MTQRAFRTVCRESHQRLHQCACLYVARSMLTLSRPSAPVNDGASAGFTLLNGDAGTMRLIGSSAACKVEFFRGIADSIIVRPIYRAGSVCQLADREQTGGSHLRSRDVTGTKVCLSKVQGDLT